MSRIVVFGAAGKAGSRVVAEAAARGHEVTAVARDGAAYAFQFTIIRNQLFVAEGLQ